MNYPFSLVDWNFGFDSSWIDPIRSFVTSPIVSGSFVLAVGVILIGIALYNLKRMRESESWPCVEGVITQSDVETSRRTVRQSRNRSTGGAAFSGGSRVEYTYSPRIRYRFTVNGVEYTGDRIGFLGRNYSSEYQAQAICMEYPVGHPTWVYYDPKRPSRAVLQPGMDFGGFLLFLAAGAAFTVTGAYMLLQLT